MVNILRLFGLEIMERKVILAIEGKSLKKLFNNPRIDGINHLF